MTVGGARVRWSALLCMVTALSCNRSTAPSHTLQLVVYGRYNTYAGDSIPGQPVVVMLHPDFCGQNAQLTKTVKSNAHGDYRVLFYATGETTTACVQVTTPPPTASTVGDTPPVIRNNVVLTKNAPLDSVRVDLVRY